MNVQEKPEMPEMPDVTPQPPTDGGSQVERDQVDAGLLGVIGVFIAVVLLLIVVMVQAWFYNWKRDVAATRTIPANDPRTQLGHALVEQQQQINSYHWINREALTRAIPIERAMELVAGEMAVEQSKSRQGGGP